jgi:hypothetical protein
MLNYSGEMPRICYIEVSTKSQDWKTWNSINVGRIESRITYDLEFDCYKVKIQRINKPSKTLCKRPFRWRLEINADYGDEGDSSSKKSNGTRFRAARADASVKTIQENIEKIFGLPHGCVCLLTPGQERAKPRTSVKSLRNKWKNN